ncbi:hypothetical protein GE061_019707 [Apolygus lucorum]|uniref:Uncharacterized protein n=1 Tax=Apolygus lucorum TaxID=248454 RepID=A0A6A4JUY3_APOLU|nr:hypothetical protein GE061_019707 [Apolygus lucorum]
MKELLLLFSLVAMTFAMLGVLPEKHCHLQKLESSGLKIVNMTRKQAGNDRFIGYEEVCRKVYQGGRTSKGAKRLL